ncbi:E3 ubiquitin-protein ligase hel2 [Sphaceloma murrayae]|uniref:E3 ubiquitin-protein ligase hel2 n=1 Tax=Sphaceloma murrayae TaxID=2082308 RepID=A0A2K1QSF1_9PEZI|nr:E3 ubiquitin-protein ligase hel2 [Sphaceloma murrayae]
MRGRPPPPQLPTPIYQTPVPKAVEVEAEEAQEEERDAVQTGASPEGADLVAVEVARLSTARDLANATEPILAQQFKLHPTEAQVVIFTDDAEKRYEDFKDSDFSTKDSNLGINYEKQEIFEDTVLLLRFNCPDGDCDVACLGWPDLHRHVKSVHHKVMCDLCTRNKKVFTHEHELFTPQDLRKHERFGDDNPGAEDQTGFKGHPECGFCKQRFYGDDELYAHCRDKHERCHVCDRRDGGRNPQYYVDYNALEVHFRKDHFLCPDQECLEKKFVVFDSEMDLKAHQLESHPNGITKGRDARKVDLSNFDYRQPHQQERPRREGRGRGRGRDPNAEPLPVSSAQPMRRDEVAYQRAMAIQSAQSVTGRTFGGALTAAEPAQTARAPVNTRDPDTVTVSRPAHPNISQNLDNLTLDDTPAANLSPQDQARRLRHAAVIERASILLKNDQPKLSEFRTKVSAYRAGTLTASGMIDSFFALFDCPSSELGKLIKELSDIFELPSKRDNLLKSWSDWKAINEDYPTLPGPSSASTSSKPGTWAASLSSPAPNPLAGLNVPSGSRVLKLKSSTAQSNRTAATRAANSGNPFPPLSSISTTLTTKNRPSVPGWLNAATAGQQTSSKVVSAPSSSRPSPVVGPQRVPVIGKGGKGGDMFPELPKAQKPVSSVFSPGYKGMGVRRVESPAVGGSVWGTKAGETNKAEIQHDVGIGGVDGDTGPKGKKKGKKQVLASVSKTTITRLPHRLFSATPFPHENRQSATPTTQPSSPPPPRPRRGNADQLPVYPLIAIFCLGSFLFYRISKSREGQGSGRGPKPPKLIDASGVDSRKYREA